jgi:phospholipase/carboxylesterase
MRWALSLALLVACDGGAASSQGARSAQGPEHVGETDGLRTFGELRARVIGEGDRLVVVLLHGYGAAGDDLVGLAERIDAPAGTRFVLPEAPLELGGSGRAWWPLDVDRLRFGEDRDLSDEIPPGLESARRKVTALLGEVQRRLGVPSSRIVLAGFSQGAMLALDVALHLEDPVAGVAALSGTLVADARWSPLMRARQGQLRVLVTHGRSDGILPFAMAERLRDRLEDSGVEVTWVAFDGGHTIPSDAVVAFERFLRDAARGP